MNQSPEHTPLFENFLYDHERFAKHSFIGGSKTRDHKAALIRILTHALECGTVLPDVRLGYGKEKLASLASKLQVYIADFGYDEEVHWAINVIEAYIAFHKQKSHPVPDIEALLDSLKANLPETVEGSIGGGEDTTASAVQDAVDFDFRKFLLNRHSVRQYQPRALDEATIRRIAANAQQCPSVCNRQINKLYAFTDRTVIKELLTYHRGNEGFEQDIHTLFIVTSNLEQLNMIGERYQGWIDGGIFAMTLALSIHAEGLGACFLNWSVEKERDMALRAKVGIPDNELVITFMSAGYLKEEFRVPKSPRKPLETILSINPAIR
ncbi:nitroreductase family protein [uncultured Cohaesibacter sp.]|uniref:nitroreductase family protein n=1 Tax=uncultured Cohaesibacter sp. TaxID=1002546 RepID=UPI00292E52EE|nr:nitroreductase family protein [uncultured Cohaesibacter sp.]